MSTDGPASINLSVPGATSFTLAAVGNGGAATLGFAGGALSRPVVFDAAGFETVLADDFLVFEEGEVAVEFFGDPAGEAVGLALDLDRLDLSAVVGSRAG